jgi:hypothetical protein
MWATISAAVRANCAARRPPTDNRGMGQARKSWAAKLRPEMMPEIVDDPKGRGRLLLPTPLLVAEEIGRLPCGSLLTLPELRARMAERLGADTTCPLMTGIFLNIVAGRAEEQLEAGEPPLAPYWRVVLEGGVLKPKTPAGPERQAEHLRSEGHVIEARGGKLVVAADGVPPGG